MNPLFEFRLSRPRPGRVLESMSVPVVLFHRSNLNVSCPDLGSSHTIDGVPWVSEALPKSGPVSIPASPGLIALTRASRSDALVFSRFVICFFSILLDGVCWE